MGLFTKRSCATTLEELREEWKNCKQCPFYTQRHSLVIGHGSTTAKVFAVGQAPADEEDETGIPFSGKAGVLCRELFQQASIPKEDLFVSNVLACRTFKDAKIRKVWAENCWNRLETELRIVKPKLIVTLGLPAADRFMVKTSGKKISEGIIFVYQGVQGFAMVHPAVLLRVTGFEKSKWKKQIDKDFQSVKELYTRVCTVRN